MTNEINKITRTKSVLLIVQQLRNSDDDDDDDPPCQQFKALPVFCYPVR